MSLRKKRFAHVAVFWLLGIFLFILVIQLEIPCWIKSLTHLDCPSCGTVRMMGYLKQGNFLSAFSQNQFMFFALPITAIFTIIASCRYVKTGKILQRKAEQLFLLTLIVIGILFAVLRNLV